MKETGDDKKMEKYLVLLEQKNKYCWNDLTTQSNLQI